MTCHGNHSQRLFRYNHSEAADSNKSTRPSAQPLAGHEIGAGQPTQMAQIATAGVAISKPEPLTCRPCHRFRRANFSPAGRLNKGAWWPFSRWLLAVVMTLMIENQVAAAAGLHLASPAGQVEAENNGQQVAQDHGHQFGLENGHQGIALNFIDSACQWSREEAPNEIEWLLLILHCDVRPMLRLFEGLVARLDGPKTISARGDLFSVEAMDKSRQSAVIWGEYLSFDSFINHFYSEATYALAHQDFCSFSTISRLGQLKSFVLGSRLLSGLYDLISIQYHSLCLEKALLKLPQVPYFVKEVVDIYIDGVDQPMMHGTNGQYMAQTSMEVSEEDFIFKVEEAIARNGPLEKVVALTITLPFNVSPAQGARAFKQSCKEYLVELDERWQAMEMMNKLLATEGNGIQTFNNYVMRSLIPTKYADACSQLSAFRG